MPGFAELLAYLAAIDAKGKSVATTMDRVASSVAEPVTDALALRRSDAATPVGSDVPAMIRILGQMRAVAEGAAEAERSIDSLTVRAEEASEEVVIKVSRTLGMILAGGEAAPGMGGTGLAGALEVIQHYNELLEIQKNARAGVEQFLVNQSVQQTADYFRRVFGQLGDIKKLSKELRDYLSATAKKDSVSGPTSGTLGSAKTASTSTTSIAVLRWTGGLR